MNLAPAPADRAHELARLRRTLALAERPRGMPRARLTFGCPGLDSCLPGEGLAAGMLHELRPLSEEERPQALGFALALASRLPPKGGPILIVTAPRGMPGHTALSGHGLKAMGCDPARILIARASNDKAALWAI